MLQDAGHPPPVAPMAAVDTDAPEASGPARAPERDHAWRHDGGPTEAPPADLESAKEALELRRTQARAALIEQTGADDAQIAQIDAATAQMNSDLAALTDDFLADADKSGPPSRREAMVYALRRWTR